MAKGMSPASTYAPELAAVVEELAGGKPLPTEGQDPVEQHAGH